VGVANDAKIAGMHLPIRFNSADGMPLWEPIAEADGTFLLEGGNSVFSTMRQGGEWPDTLLVFYAPDSHEPLKVGFHPIFEMFVTPSEMGTVSFETAPSGPIFDPATFILAEGANAITVGLEAPDIEVAPLTDCDGNGIDDAVELADGTASDCNSNGLIDECEVADGIADDCNGNMFPDECEPDDDLDGIPDDCEEIDDCNYNGVPDLDDIASGFSSDTNLNGLPDECEGLAGNSIRIFVPLGSGHESQHMLLGEPVDILVAAVNDVEIGATYLPVEFSSADGNPVWPAVTETSLTFLPEGEENSGHLVLLIHLNGTWPDTLVVVANTSADGPMLPGFHVLYKLTVTPEQFGTINWAPAPVPGDYFPPQFLTADLNTEFEVPVIAPPILVGGCCVGRVGNVNQAGGEEPTIGDITALIDHLFITQAELRCVPEADINGSGGAQPTSADVTIGDITALISYLFGGTGTLPDCP
jgi:hypothetical protein